MVQLNPGDDDGGEVDREYEEFMKRAGAGSGQGGFNEYSFQKNAKHYSHDPNESSGFEAKQTLLSRKAKRTLQTEPKDSLSFVNENDFSKVQPKLAESELRENTLLKNLEESNNTLRAELVKVADEKEELERQLRKLKTRVEDLESDLQSRDKWRAKALELEELRESEERDRRRRERDREEQQEQLRKAEKDRDSVRTRLETTREEVKRLQERIQNSNGELNDLLNELRKGDGGENRDLLKEVIKKVDELSKKSRSERPRLTEATINEDSRGDAPRRNEMGENQNFQEGSQSRNMPHFFNQPHYQMSGAQGPNAKTPNFYVNLIVEENSKLKKENELLIEQIKKLKKNVGNKKRRILNEIANLICTKNAFESRFVSEITQCPYREVVVEKNVTDRIFSQASHF